MFERPPITLMAEAQHIIEVWRLDYHQRRPHSSLGHLIQNESIAQRQGIRTTEEVVCSG
jgi:transposase InsO family protein